MARSKYKKIDRDATPPSRRPKAGMARWTCQEHGFIADVHDFPDVVAWCPCGRLGKIIFRTPRKEES